MKDEWQEIAKEAALRLTGFESGREHKAAFKTVLAAIERAVEPYKEKAWKYDDLCK
jgi:hypothetical protein